jgi:hypothetical protein
MFNIPQLTITSDQQIDNCKYEEEKQIIFGWRERSYHDFQAEDLYAFNEPAEGISEVSPRFSVSLSFNVFFLTREFSSFFGNNISMIIYLI